MRDCLLDRPRPDEAEVAVTRLDGKPPDKAADVDTRAVHVQLRVAEAIREPAGANVEDLGADDVTVERVGRLPVGDRDHAMVETQGLAHDPDDRARERPFRA